MYNVNKKVSVRWKLNTDAFPQMNKAVIGNFTKKIGTDIAAVKRMLLNDEMLRMIMPDVLGISYNSHDTNWHKTIKSYFDSISVDVPRIGIDLEIGHSYSIDTGDPERRKYIAELKTKTKTTIFTDKSFAEYVEENIPFDERYKYSKPINPNDFILYQHCKVYRDVANSVNDITKPSENIRFYIHDDEITKKNEIDKNKRLIVAQKTLIHILEASDGLDIIKNILYLCNKEDIISIDRLTSDEINIQAFALAGNKPEEFIAAATNKNLNVRATIERYIHANLLKRLSNTDIIVDSDDPTLVLGNTTDEVITWFSLELNAPKISEYVNRYKALKQ